MPYRYYIYGMHVESDIKIEEALVDSSDNVADVCYRIGQMPEPERTELASFPIDKFTLKRINDGVIFRIADTADYYVTKDCITVSPIDGADSNRIKCFLLGSSSGFMFVLRQMVAIHGGGIAKNGKGVIITGESGAGKSTVANSLRDRGYEFISDDVCVITKKHDEVRINLAYPQQKLCRDAALRMGYSLDELIYINEDRDKFAVRLKDGFRAEGEKFSYLFEIMLSNYENDEDDVSFTELVGHDALAAIIRNIYRGSDAFSLFGIKPMYMKLLLDIAKDIKVYQIKRPKGRDTLDYIVEKLEQVILQD